MKRIGEAWFSFCGVRSDAMGLKMARMPVRGSAARRGENVRVPGRSGGLWIDGGAYEQMKIGIECESADGFDEKRVRAWLQGAGELVFSDEQDRAYSARAAQGCEFESAVEGYDRLKVQAEFVCQPLRMHRPEAEEIVLASAGTVMNPGSAQSEPRIFVEAEGDFALAVNGELIEVTGGSIVIDSELRDCLSPDGAQLANGRATLDAFPVLKPGANLISWTGDVSKVAIRPRWRDL